MLAAARTNQPTMFNIHVMFIHFSLKVDAGRALDIGDVRTEYRERFTFTHRIRSNYVLKHEIQYAQHLAHAMPRSIGHGMMMVNMFVSRQYASFDGTWHMQETRK